MTRDEYFQMLKNSQIFQLLDEKTQRLLLSAEGKTMEIYIKIFTSAAEIEKENIKKFITNSQSLYSKFLHDFQGKKKQVRIIMEQANQIEDEMEIELLLDEANSEN